MMMKSHGLSCRSLHDKDIPRDDSATPRMERPSNRTPWYSPLGLLVVGDRSGLLAPDLFRVGFRAVEVREQGSEVSTFQS